MTWKLRCIKQKAKTLAEGLLPPPAVMLQREDARHPANNAREIDAACVCVCVFKWKHCSGHCGNEQLYLLAQGSLSK